MGLRRLQFDHLAESGRTSPAYQAELLLPVRDANLRRAAVGTVLKVKYLRDQPTRLVYQD